MKRKRGRRGFMALKIDLAKAYDILRWVLCMTLYLLLAVLETSLL